MIITKEQQQSWIDNYIKEKHTQDECAGFIDGVEKVISVISQETGKAPRQLADENKMLVEALKWLLDGINYSDACRGKFAHFWPKESNGYKAAIRKAYVGSKGIPSDEQIVRAIEVLNEVTEKT